MSAQYKIKNTELLIEDDDTDTSSLLITRSTDIGLYSVISVRIHETRGLSLVLAHLAQRYEENLSVQRTIH